MAFERADKKKFKNGAEIRPYWIVTCAVSSTDQRRTLGKQKPVYNTLQGPFKQDPCAR